MKQNEEDTVMENEIVMEIEKEDKKLRGKYLLIILACFIGGGAFGVIAVLMRDKGILGVGLAKGFSAGLKWIAPYMVLVLAVVTMISMIVFYRQSRKLYASWDGEDEEVYGKIDGKLGIAMMISMIDMILFYLFIVIWLASMMSDERTDEIPALIVFFLGFLVTMISMIYGQQKIVNFLKEMNPEKKGSVYDIKFQKKWIDSCDEAEKNVIYQAGFASYQAVNKTCIGLMLFNMVGILFWDFGIAPVCMVAILWLVSSVSYCIKSGQFTKKKREI